MQETPKGDRLHIAIFGRRNAGKSSLINALTNQDIALVSEIPGTTTDPVYKAMEILPIGPVMLIDTAGIDDVGKLGSLRVEKTKQVLNKTDLAILLIEPDQGISEIEIQLLESIYDRKIPVLGAINKVDIVQLQQAKISEWSKQLKLSLVEVSASTGQGIEELKSKIISIAPESWEGPPIIADLLNPGEVAVLVVPIDLAAPKGRLILPQVQTIREILDHDALAVVVKERELREGLDKLKNSPKIVVTDSQAFLKVAGDTPDDVLMTSFSILFARHKGDLESFIEGVKGINKLKPHDKILIAEGCTHHRQADDIGQVKIPRWLRQMVGGDLEFDWVSGGGFPDDLSKYKLIVHCASCMLTRREMLYRISQARKQGIPIVNYGVLIAHVHGILSRALRPFPLASMLWEDSEC